MTCRYCKIDFTLEKWAEGKRGCVNCLNYADATTAAAYRRAEQELFKVYQSLPFNWRDSDDWRNDTYYKKTKD